ncbi:MAG TPA: FISUMP domain-containing protein [Fibrobacteraceae bacterium]|nr:FISUMP domain-containing protein [Fibrobacteraceae bacterium]
MIHPFSLLLVTASVLLVSCDDTTNSVDEKSSSCNSALAGSSTVYSSSNGDSLFPSSSEIETSSSSHQSSSQATSSAASSSFAPSSSVSEIVRVVDGIITDPRDSIEYKVAVIGSQTWMAENLRFHGDCFDWYHDCDLYGPFYAWSTADTVCPEGWHLPTTTEWRTLITYATNNGGGSAGKSLKANIGWTAYENDTAGFDVFGFAALPAGFCRDLSNCTSSDNVTTRFWTSIGGFSMSNSYTSDNVAYYVSFDDVSGSSDVPSISYYSENMRYSVRCIMDTTTDSIAE